jgi:hypothetical protein
MIFPTSALAFTMNPQCATIGATLQRGGVECTCALSLGGFITARHGHIMLLAWNLHYEEDQACRREALRELGMR